MKPTRPKWNEEMLKELSEYTGKILKEWCNNETSLEDCIELSEKVLKWNCSSNGYELAREFEEHGFSPDTLLVEELDSVSYEHYSILEKHIKQWVSDNNIQLSYPIGTIVSYKDRSNGLIMAEIMTHYPDKAQYGIWWEGLGDRNNVRRIVTEQDFTIESVELDKV